MKDIPIFTSSGGIATLILREIPIKGEGYVLLRSVFTTTDALLRECADFCVAAGAERVFVSGQEGLSHLPVYACLIERTLPRNQIPPTEAIAVPIQSEDADRWASQYNEKFRTVPSAQSCRKPENAYDIYLHGKHIGIGQIHDSKLDSVAALEPHMGQACVSALAAQCKGETLHLLCAVENLPAMKLYDRMGFSVGPIKECWYQVR